MPGHRSRSRSRSRDRGAQRHGSSRDYSSSHRADDRGDVRRTRMPERDRGGEGDRYRSRDTEAAGSRERRDRHEDRDRDRGRGGGGDNSRHGDHTRRDDRQSERDSNAAAAAAAAAAPQRRWRSPSQEHERDGKGAHEHAPSSRGGGGGGGPGGGGKHARDAQPPNHSSRHERDLDWGTAAEREEAAAGPKPAVVVQPIMELSGKLAAETNKVAGVQLKYQPPPEAAKPDKKWRLYVFKGKGLAEDEEPLYLHRQDHCLFGRDPNVADVLCAHPSISKQHAVIQFRRVPAAPPGGEELAVLGGPQEVVKPYLMDLATTNGTFLNGEQLEGQRYYELLPKDVIKFGQSSRDYVLLHEDLA